MNPLRVHNSYAHFTTTVDHDRIFCAQSLGARPMVGLQTLDLPIEVRILCPQPAGIKHP